MSTITKNAESLFRGKAIALSATEVSDWHSVKSCSNLAFFTRMTSAGSPSLAISIDYSPFSPGDVIAPGDAFQTVALIATYTTKWNGTVGAGTFTYTACPAEVLAGAVSIRARVVEGAGVAVTAFDTFVVKTTRI
jgi:hypothetical protein